LDSRRVRKKEGVHSSKKGEREKIEGPTVREEKAVTSIRESGGRGRDSYYRAI